MDALKEFTLPFVGLKEGKHQFEFTINGIIILGNQTHMFEGIERFRDYKTKIKQFNPLTFHYQPK